MTRPRTLAVAVAVATTLAGAFACSSSGSSSSSSSGAAEADSGGGGDAAKPNPLGCPFFGSDGCPVYRCTCNDGSSVAKAFSGERTPGTCDTAEVTCARACFNFTGAANFACGADPNPKPVEAGLPRGSAGGPCSAGDICSERDFATCADLTVQLMRSSCPASGTCPTKTEAENAACAAHGGPQRI